MQTTTGRTILSEQMATLWRQADGECGTLFYQHHVSLAVDQVLTNGRNLDMNLRFVAKLFDYLDLAFQGDVGDFTGQQMFRANAQRHIGPG